MLIQDPLIEHNLKKIKELLPAFQAQTTNFMYEAFRQGKRFKISKAYESEADHLITYISGRIEKDIDKLKGRIDQDLEKQLRLLMDAKPTLRYGEILTNFLESSHAQWKAFDVKPLNCSFTELHDLSIQFGIDWTILDERWHFEIVSPLETPVEKVKRNFFSLFRRG